MNNYEVGGGIRLKFIVEDDLRDLYKKEPFTSYEIESGSKLTPGARQFLADRGILIQIKENSPTKENKKNKIGGNRSRGMKALFAKLKSAEVQFLLTAEEIVTKDVLLAQNLVSLSKCILEMERLLKGQLPSEKNWGKNCTGITEENFDKEIEECFQISEFHMQLENGKQILQLDQLRWLAREIEPMLLEVYEKEEITEMQCQQLIGYLNTLVNSISQLICISVGGKECQRKAAGEQKE